MKPQLRDFVSTYRPPKQPEPFFGFFEVDVPRKRRTCGRYYKNKLARNSGEADRKPLITKNYNLHYDYTIHKKRKRKPVYKIKKSMKATELKNRKNEPNRTI